MKNVVSMNQMRGVIAATAAVSMTAIMFYSPSVMCTLLLSSAVGMALRWQTLRLSLRPATKRWSM